MAVTRQPEDKAPSGFSSHHTQAQMQKLENLIHVRKIPTLVFFSSWWNMGGNILFQLHEKEYSEKAPPPLSPIPPHHLKPH